MTKQTKVEVDLHDDEINEIVEETLEETAPPVAKVKKNDDGVISEPESIASVDAAADAVKSQAPVPKTKAGMVNAMYQKINAMKKVDLQAAYGNMMGESVDAEETTLVVDTTAELDALVESEATLSDEFKSKTAVIFEAAVKTKLSEEVSRLEEQYKEELSEEVSSMKEDMVQKVDSYLNYVVETWVEDNKLAIQNGLRTEIAESFMNKMKDLFTESYIDVPESKVDLVDELAEQVEELEEKLNSQTGDSIKLAEELETYKRNAIITEASRGMAETQVEKLRGLVENVDFDDEESFTSKVATIKESFFKTENKSVSEITAEEVDTEVHVSSMMESYIQAIKKSTVK